MISTAVIPVAGKGTRLLPFTKEMPKEMLPLFHRDSMKPIVQIVFEELFDSGIRNFIFIVGIGKRAIEDHFTPENTYKKILEKNVHTNIKKSMSKFYSRINNSKIAWINQPEPKGFGDAILKAESYVGKKPFLVHAGDACILGHGSKNIIQRVCEKFIQYDADGVVATMQIKNKKDLHQYGIVTLNSEQIIKIIEKPRKPETNIAVMPIYVFNNSIFKSLKNIRPGFGNEMQLTDGISGIIKTGKKVFSCSTENDVRLDVGTPDLYLESLTFSFTVHF